MNEAEFTNVRWWCDEAITTPNSQGEGEWLIVTEEHDAALVGQVCTFALAERICALHNATVFERDRDHG